MTAVDVDALAKLREAHEEWRTDGLDVDTTDGRVWNLLFRRPRWMDADDVHRLVAMHNALPDLIAEVRRGRALREAVEGLAGRYEGQGWRGTAERLRALLATVDGGEQ